MSSVLLLGLKISYEKIRKLKLSLMQSKEKSLGTTKIFKPFFMASANYLHLKKSQNEKSVFPATKNKDKH